jgi:hypothetical protein
MKPPKSFICLAAAAAVCALAVCNARAIVVASPAFTNFVTISIVGEGQGTISTNTVNDTTSFAKPKRGTLNTAQFLVEVGGVTIGTNFTKAAKLVYIEGGSSTNGFAVIDGAMFVSVSNIMSLNTSVSTNMLRSGIQSNTNGLALKTLSDISIVELDYDDTIPSVGGSLAFNLRGIATATTTDTVPSNTGTYTKTFSAKLTGTGSGVSDGPFLLTGTASFSGSGVLILPPAF